MRKHSMTLLVAACLTACIAVSALAGPPSRGRHVRFNRHDLDRIGWAVLLQIEAATRTRIPDGEYWYDPACGAAGIWGGPALAFLPAGLPLGGKVPAAASGGGRGRVTGVFVNGRELHPRDVQVLTQIYGVPPQPGRYWVDRAGNAGYEGGPAIINLVQAARQRWGGSAGGAGGGWYHRTWGAGGDMYSGSDGQSTYFFDSASGCSVMNDGGGVSC
ncbi:MAG TPA: hypothetical protein VKB80_04085 [Kofleriaceae bacterium]|nr:hypothetical protein [Kofleriaceae bacterium]